VLLAIASTGVSLHAQPVRARAVTGAGAQRLAWTAAVETMLRTGNLDIDGIQADTMVAGRTHERLGQRHAGLPVFGGAVVRQMAGRATLSVFGRLFDNVALPDVTPVIDARQAAAAAERHAGGKAGPAQLGILPAAGRFVLVYRMTLRGPWNVRLYDVNAATGAIERVQSLLRHQTVSVGTGTGVLNDQKKISAVQSGGSWEAIDRLRPSEARTLDFHGSVSRLINFIETGDTFPSDVARSTSNSWTDGSVVDAHVYAGLTYDYLFRRFGRRGLDDRNLPIISIVHPLARSEASLFDPEVVDTFINNAVYAGDGIMLYGDGDGFAFNFFSGALDVVAHELTHGVTDFTSALVYEDEPGALNEAFSDIMAVGAEHFHQKPGQGPQKGPNFEIGEDVTRGFPGFVRSLRSPTLAGYPDHYSLRLFIGTPIDNGGVHVNSGIVGHAFYLAVAGGTNRVSGISVEGIGLASMERMERIFYRAFSFMLTPFAQFSDARAATLQAAADLYGASSRERTQLERAWNAVGVF
jgi:bacillolysin